MHLTKRDFFYLMVLEELEALDAQLEEKMQWQISELLNLAENPAVLTEDPLRTAGFVGYLDQVNASLRQIPLQIAEFEEKRSKKHSEKLCDRL